MAKVKKLTADQKFQESMSRWQPTEKPTFTPTQRNDTQSLINKWKPTTPTPVVKLLDPKLPIVTKTTTPIVKNKKIVQQGKVAMKGLVRPDNPAAPLFVNALNTASFGLLERNSKVIEQLKEKAPISSTIGSMLGYIAPGGAVKGLVKPVVSKIVKPLAKRVIEGALIGGGIEGISGAVGNRGIEQTKKNVAYGVALGGVADLGVYGIGKGIKALKSIPSAKQSAFNLKFGDMPNIDNTKVLKPTGLKATNTVKGLIPKKEIPKVQFTQGKFNNMQSKLKGLLNTDETVLKPNTSNFKADNSNIPTNDKLMPNKPLPTQNIISTPQLSEVSPVLNNGKSKFANETLKNSANTSEQFAKDLKSLDLGYDKVTNANSLMQANKRISDNLEDSVRYVLNNKEAGSAEHTTTAIQLINKFQNEGNYERAIDIASDISSKLTKNGQAIQAASIYDRLSPDGILLYAQRQVTKLNDNRWFKGLTKEQKINPELAKQLKELADNMKNLTGDAKTEASQELQQALQSLGKSTLGRKLESAQTIGQLLNPKTMGRNIISNEMFYRVERINKYIATPIDIARSAITGGERTVTFKTGGQGGYWDGWMKGTKAGWKGVNPAGLTTQYNLTAPAFSGKWNPMTYLEKALGANLKGFDYAAYKRAVNQTVGEMGELAAINSKLTGAARKTSVQEFVKNANKNILDTADQYGKYVTFQDDNVLSKGLSAVKRGMNLGKDFGVGSLVIKYPKTPGALIMRGLDYSAAGFLKSAYQVAKPLLKGGKIDTREATMALSRGITGTLGFTGLGYFLAEKGVITGRTNKDADVREMQKQTGGGSYKVNLTALERWAKSGFNPSSLDLQQNDTMFSYDWAAPIAMAVSFGANINSNLEENKGALNSTSSVLASSLEGSIGTIAEQPVLQGLAKQFQGYDLGQNVTNTLKGIPSSFTPTVLNQVRQYQDNTGRNTYDQSPIKDAFNKSQVKLPGPSSKLPVDYDTEGKPKQNYQENSNSLVNVFLNPGFVSKNIPTKVQKEVLRLYETTGEKNHFPSVALKSINATKDNPKVILSGSEMSEYQKLMGQKTLKAYDRLVDNYYYNILETDMEKAEMLEKAMTKAKTEAKIELLKKLGKYTGDK